MPIEQLNAIYSELAQIKIILIVTCAFITIAALATLVGGYFRVVSGLRRFTEDQFTREITELFERAELLEVIARSKAVLVQRPNHEYARWYLARALFLKGDLSESL